MKLLKPAASRSAFEKTLAARKIELADLIPGTGFALMCAFYAARRAEGCAVEDDGDALQFQWGTFDLGTSERFTLGITRQFMWQSKGEDVIKQLALGFEYQPTRELRALGEGSGWCQSLEHLEEFVTFVTTARAYVALEQVEAARVTLKYAGV